MKKRTTLVRNFDEIIKSGDIEAFKAVFEKCDISATGGYGKGTALHFHGLSDEMIRWLVANGADLEAEDTYRRTPLYAAVSRRSGEIRVLLTLGANVRVADYAGNTPLHSAAGNAFHPENVKLLLAGGADALAKNDNGQTPLVYALACASNGDIEALSEIADLLLTAQTPVMPEMRQSVAKIGKNFAFYRADFNPEYLPQTEAALERLYTLFQVEPVAARKVHDGSSQITVEAGSWQKQLSLLWELLVPGNGVASTVQGEVIRICGKVAREILDNGAMNWDRDYKKLSQALPGYFALGSPLEPSLSAEAIRLAKGISANSDDEELDRLSELAVQWVLANPTPIPLTMVDYKR